MSAIHVMFSCKMRMDAAIVITGTMYMYALVFTAPSTPTDQFHVTKQSADAPAPRNSMFNRLTWEANGLSVKRKSNRKRCGIMKISP